MVILIEIYITKACIARIIHCFMNGLESLQHAIFDFVDGINYRLHHGISRNWVFLMLKRPKIMR